MTTIPDWQLADLRREADKRGGDAGQVLHTLLDTYEDHEAAEAERDAENEKHEEAVEALRDALKESKSWADSEGQAELRRLLEQCKGADESNALERLGEIEAIASSLGEVLSDISRVATEALAG